MGTVHAVDILGLRPATHPDPFPLRGAVCVGFHRGEQFLVARLRQRRPVALYAHHAGVCVTVDQSGEHQLAAEVDAPGGFARMLPGARGIADIHKALVFDRHGLGPWLAGILGVEPATRQHQIGHLCGRRISRSAAG